MHNAVALAGVVDFVISVSRDVPFYPRYSVWASRACMVGRYSDFVAMRAGGAVLADPPLLAT